MTNTLIETLENRTLLSGTDLTVGQEPASHVAVIHEDFAGNKSSAGTTSNSDTAPPRSRVTSLQVTFTAVVS